MAFCKGLRGRFRGMTVRDYEPAHVSIPHICEHAHFATQCRYLTATPADSPQLQSPLTVMHCSGALALAAALVLEFGRP